MRHESDVLFVHFDESLPSEFSRPLELTQAVALRVSVKVCGDILRLTESDALLRLSTYLPHIKRVRRVVDNADDEKNSSDDPIQSCSALLQHGYDLADIIIDIKGPKSSLTVSTQISNFLHQQNLSAKCHTVEVPMHSPMTRQQYKEWSTTWPLTYRQPSSTPINFTPELLRECRTGLDLVFLVAAEVLWRRHDTSPMIRMMDDLSLQTTLLDAIQFVEENANEKVSLSQKLNGKTLCEFEEIIYKETRALKSMAAEDLIKAAKGLWAGVPCSASCVILSPGGIICGGTVSHGSTITGERQILKHAVMMAIEEVSALVRDDDTIWNKEESKVECHDELSVSLRCNLSSEFIHSGRSRNMRKELKTRSQSGRIQFSESRGNEYSDSQSNEKEENERKFNRENRKRDSMAHTMEKAVDVEYLCTGCTAYVSFEPCLMCAMALNLSRVVRIVLPGEEVFRNRVFGGLGGAFDIREKRQLNHNFRLLRGWRKGTAEQTSIVV